MDPGPSDYSFIRLLMRWVSLSDTQLSRLRHKMFANFWPLLQVDGSQARRTGQSGPLGELFDHGVDALNTSLEVLLFAATMKLGQSWRTVLVLFGSLLTFYVQTWDEYHTKTLTLGFISGPVEGIITLCIVYAITAVKGGGWYWQQSVLETFGVPRFDWIPDIVWNQDFGDFYILYGGLVLTYNTIERFVPTMPYRYMLSSLTSLSSARNVVQTRRDRGEQARVALLGLFPFFSAWALIVAYLMLQPEILTHHLVPFVFYVGLINAYSVGQIITAHLVVLDFPYQNIIAFPLTFGIIDALGPRLQQLFGFGWPSALGEDIYQVAFMFTCLGLAVGIYGSFVVDVIVTICDYLDIWCLTIKYPQARDAGSAWVTRSTRKKKVG